jgi:hypothetical protein
MAAPDGVSSAPHLDPDRVEWGMIAQEIEAGAPDLIAENEGVKAFDVAGTIAVLVAKIKSLEARLDHWEPK